MQGTDLKERLSHLLPRCGHWAGGLIDCRGAETGGEIGWLRTLVPASLWRRKWSVEFFKAGDRH